MLYERYLHTVAPSSMANSTPPMGAMKAAATPQALPSTAKSRFQAKKEVGEVTNRNADKCSKRKVYRRF